MKKIKILSIILMCCVVLAGCSVNNNLALSGTNYTAAAFYSKTITDLNFVVGEGQFVVDSSLLEEYQSINGSIENFNNYFYGIISVGDFCVGIANGIVDSTQTQKIYEYKNGTVTIVNKLDKNGKFEFNVYSSVDSYQNIESLVPELSSKYVFTKSSNGSFTFKEDIKTNASSGTFLFDSNNGKLSFSLTVIEEGLDSKNTYFTSVDIYNFKSEIVGGRICITKASGGTTKTIVNEFLLKDYYKKAKIGVIKNVDNQIDLLNSEEKFVATHNENDQFVFDIVYNDTINNASSITTATAYGVIG